MPYNTNFSFVLVQHLSPDHKSLMGELLAKHTSMRIIEAEDNMLLLPNCIYLIPSRKVMTLTGGFLKLHDKDRHQELEEYHISKPADYIGIGVTDNGIGFDDRYKEKIFGIFQRLHNNQYQGTGIGLAVCKKIVDNHDGFIRAESEEGKGSRFIIILPRSKKRGN